MRKKGGNEAGEEEEEDRVEMDFCALIGALYF